MTWKRYTTARMIGSVKGTKPQKDLANSFLKIIAKGKTTLTLLQTSAVDTAPEIMDAFAFECDKQKRLHTELVSEGYTIADDPADLAKNIGTVQEIECLCDMWTPRLLCKLYVKGTESLEHSFHLVPLHQLVKWGYVVPQPGTLFKTNFVVGVRRVSDNEFVPAFRLPLK